MDLTNYIITSKPDKRFSVRLNETELATIRLFSKQRKCSMNNAFRLLIAAAGSQLDL